MNRANFVGLIVLFASVACGSDLTKPVPPAARPPIDSVVPVVPVVPSSSGTPLTGTWRAAPGAGYTNLIIDVKEDAFGHLEGSWTATHAWCGCALSGRLSVEGAPVVQAPGSHRAGSAVTLFLTVGSGPFVLGGPWGSFAGNTVDATHMSGTLFYSDGSGYFGDDGVSQTVVLSR